MEMEKLILSATHLKVHIMQDFLTEMVLHMILEKSKIIGVILLIMGALQLDGLTSMVMERLILFVMMFMEGIGQELLAETVQI
jgi:hypothetical protein